MRSPAEYGDDHVPGARNFPVLNDAQRAEVGTIYKRRSPFEAKKRGAGMVADNVSRLLRTHFRERGGSWKPLVYCWRGGTRSAALTHVLREIGWRAEQLPGGYKAYRRTVIETIDRVAPQLRFKVLCGYTGTGKSRVLAGLARHGAQVIDLEALANHRGSALGAPTTGEQPSQKRFESLLCETMRKLDPDRPVHVEAESRRIGKIQVPDALLEAMRASECIRMEADLPARAGFLVREYRHFIEDNALLDSALRTLTRHAGKSRVERWTDWRKHGSGEDLVEDLLCAHYDPLYLRSMKKHFTRYADAAQVRLDAINAETLDHAARAIVEQSARDYRTAAP